jgi:hypothetical protein
MVTARVDTRLVWRARARSYASDAASTIIAYSRGKFGKNAVQTGRALKRPHDEGDE